MLGSIEAKTTGSPRRSQQARKVNNQVTSKYLPQDGVKVVGITAGVKPNKEYGGRRGFRIRVRIHPEEFSGDLPEKVDDIPIIKKHVREPPGYGDSCQKYSDDPNSPEGGTYMELDNGDWGSLGATVTYNDTKGYLTAAHIWDTCPSGISGDKVYHNGYQLGVASEWNGDEDWLFIDFDSNNLSMDSHVWDSSDDKSIPYNGYVTESGIADLIDSGKTVFQQGTTSGTEDGAVLEMNMTSGWDCVDWNGYGVESGYASGTYFGDGDSGGPVYEPRYFSNTEYAYLINLGCKKVSDCASSVDCNGVSNEVCERTRGTGYYHITNNHPIDLWL